MSTPNQCICWIGHVVKCPNISANDDNGGTTHVLVSHYILNNILEYMAILQKCMHLWAIECMMAISIKMRVAKHKQVMHGQMYLGIQYTQRQKRRQIELDRELQDKTTLEANDAWTNVLREYNNLKCRFEGHLRFIKISNLSPIMHMEVFDHREIIRVKRLHESNDVYTIHQLFKTILIANIGCMHY